MDTKRDAAEHGAARGVAHALTTRSHAKGPQTLAANAASYARGDVFGRPVAVFPVRPTGKEPLTDNGFHGATTDLKEIAAWWECRPDANIGLPLEANGLCAVDLDGSEGLATWRILGPEHPGPVTCAGETGGGGAHLIYAIPPGRKPRGTVRVFPGIDLRGPGYLVAPGSVHSSGDPYTWVMPPWRLAPQLAPEWILETDRPPRPPVGPRFVETDGHSPYGRAALVGGAGRPGLLVEVASAPVGQRNATLYRAARRVLDLVEGRDLEHGNAWNALVLAAHDCGLPEREILATLESASGGHGGA